MEIFGDRTNRDRTNKINFLPPECIIEDSPVLVVNKELFFNFIEFEEKEKESLIKKLMKVFNKNSL